MFQQTATNTAMHKQTDKPPLRKRPVHLQTYDKSPGLHSYATSISLNERPADMLKTTSNTTVRIIHNPPIIKHPFLLNFTTRGNRKHDMSNINRLSNTPLNAIAQALPIHSASTC